MRPEDFRLRLDAASFYATNFAASMVKGRLAYEFRYCVVLNASQDEGRKEDEVVYPDDDGAIHDDLAADEVVKLLCRDGRVPQWIDIAVAYRCRNHTQLSLTCCGRFHGSDDRLYYYGQGTQPFGIKSPKLPSGYKNGRKLRLPSGRDFVAKQRAWYCHANEADDETEVPE